MLSRTEAGVKKKKPDVAVERFTAAFERLKANQPLLLPKGTPVSQNNVAREAGVDPSALRVRRYPELIQEIKAYVRARDAEAAKDTERRTKIRENRKSLQQEVAALTLERDNAQSQLVSAHAIILRLLQEQLQLQASLDELRPPPTRLQ